MAAIIAKIKNGAQPLSVFIAPKAMKPDITAIARNVLTIPCTPQTMYMETRIRIGIPIQRIHLSFFPLALRILSSSSIFALAFCPPDEYVPNVDNTF